MFVVHTGGGVRVGVTGAGLVVFRVPKWKPRSPRRDQPVDQTRALDLVAPAERLDDALHVAATLAGVLDQVEIS